MSPSGRNQRGPWWGLALRGLVLSAALVFLARGVRWDDIVVALGRAGVVLPIVVVIMNAGMMSFRALRLRILLEKRITFASSFATLLTSSALNNITPFRGGHVARLWMIERASGVTKSAALAITLVENLIELAVLAMLGFGASWFAHGQRWASIATPVAFTGTMVVLLLLRASVGSPAAPEGAPSSSRGLSAKLRRFVAKLRPGFGPLSLPGVSAQAFVLSLLAWICEATMILLCARSMGLAIPFPLALVVLLGINFALALPSTPASAGPFEGATVAVLVLSGLAKGPAIGFALFYHALQVIPVTVAGTMLLLVARRRHRTADAMAPHATTAPARNLQHL